MDRKEIAVTLHQNHFNCAQCIVCAFSNVLGADAIQAFKMAEALGLGMGSMGTCGCLTAAAMMVGMKKSDGDLDNPRTRRQCYMTMQMITREFEEKFGSTICAELKSGKDENGEDKDLFSCNDRISYTVEMLDRHLLGISDGENEIRVIKNPHAKF